MTLTGVTGDCATTTVTITMNGQSVAHTIDCHNGTFSITFIVPAPEPGKSNVVSASVYQGGIQDDMDFPVA